MKFDRRTAAALVAVAGLVLAAGCGGGAPAERSDAAQREHDSGRVQEEWLSSRTTATTTATTTTATSAPEPKPNIYALGETYYGTNADVTVGKPTPHHGPGVVILAITAENKSAQILESYDWLDSVTVDESRAEKDYSAVTSAESRPPDILPGKAGAWKVAVKVPTDARELTFALSLGMSDSVYWTGPLG